MPLWSPVSSLLFYLLLLVLLAVHVTVCTSAESSCYFCGLPWLAAGGVMMLVSALLCAVLSALAKASVGVQRLREVRRVPAEANPPLLRRWCSPGTYQAQRLWKRGQERCSEGPRGGTQSLPPSHTQLRAVGSQASPLTWKDRVPVTHTGAYRLAAHRRWQPAEGEAQGSDCVGGVVRAAAEDTRAPWESRQTLQEAPLLDCSFLFKTDVFL